VSKEILVGLDVGTSSVKALFITTTGEVIRRVEHKLTTKYEAGGVAQQDAVDYWEAVKSIFAQVPDLLDQIAAIGLSGQTPSVVCIDELGTPTYPVLIWQDNRATSEAAKLVERFGNPTPWVGTSLPWASSGSPAKLFWLAENEREVVKRTKWVLQPKDYLGFKLTGEAISDPWSSKGLCNVLTGAAIPEVFEFIGWDAAVLPLIKTGTLARGNVSAAAAAELGLHSFDIPVSVGLSDAMCGMLSIGALTERKAFIITGTSAIVGMSTDQDIDDAQGLYVIPKTCSPMTVVYGPTQSSGAAVDWVAKLFNISIDEVMNEAQQANTDLTPIFLPYISGERAPIWRTDIRGSFNFVDAAAERPEFLAAVLDGISFAERSVLETAAQKLEADFDDITLGGHAGNDHRWDTIRLRTLGKRLIRKTDIDSTTRGSAILALVLLTGSITKSVATLSPTSDISTPLGADNDYSLHKYKFFLKLRDATLELIDIRF
jgi:xylulokinase